MDILDLAAPCGEVIIPGTQAKLYLVCACDVTTFPGYLATTGVGDSITLDGNIVLATGKKFAEIDITMSTGEITHTAVGVRGSKNYTNKFDFECVKSIAADEWFNQNPNGCFIGIVKQKDGQMRVFGTPDMPAFMEAAEGKTGKANGDAANWIASIMDETGVVSPFYTGTIDLTA